jgi:hypothetical protein
MLGDEVERGFLTAVSWSSDPPQWSRGGSGRLQLADWIADPQNPLTARVLVNRVWHHLFGAGLVRSVDNFGLRGERPTHPELLDHLALRFMQDGWSVKRLIRHLVLSRTYRQSTVNRLAVERDPENRLLARGLARRLEAEAIRDAMLVVSGQLSGRRGGPSLPLRQSGNLNPVSTGIMRDAPKMDSEQLRQRSIYLPVKRKSPFDPIDFLGAFDLPDTNQETGQRSLTTVPTQSLYLLNSTFVQQCSRAMAERLAAQSDDPVQRVEQLYLAAYGRPATEAEIKQALNFVTQMQVALAEGTAPASDGPSQEASCRAWTRLCQSLLISNEFLFRE